jgi:TonB family protein
MRAPSACRRAVCQPVKALSRNGVVGASFCKPTEASRVGKPRSPLPFPARLGTILALSLIPFAAVTLGGAFGDQYVELIGEDPTVDGVAFVQAPTYNAYRITGHGIEGRAAGVVTVEIKIDSTGAVIDASVLSDPGFPLLPAWAEAAARGWRFNPSSESWARHAVLEFSFEGAISDAKPRGVLATYESPLTLHVQYLEPTVAFLERVDGRIPEKTCEVHHLPMTVELVPLSYGLPRGVVPDSPEAAAQGRWWDAQANLFPNAPRRKLGGCSVSSETQAEVYICPACRAERDRWFEEHPGFDPLW